MGWFCLGGRDNQSPHMGIYEPLMDPTHDSEIAYLRLLSQAKVRASSWLTHGRAMRTLPLFVNGTMQKEDNTLSGTWLNADGSSLLVIVTTVQRYSPAFSLKFNISMVDYGFTASGESEFDVSLLQIPHGEVSLGRYAGDAVCFDGVLAAREVTLLRITQLQ